MRCSIVLLLAFVLGAFSVLEAAVHGKEFRTRRSLRKQPLEDGDIGEDAMEGDQSEFDDTSMYDESNDYEVEAGEDDEDGHYGSDDDSTEFEDDDERMENDDMEDEEDGAFVQTKTALTSKEVAEQVAAARAKARATVAEAKASLRMRQPLEDGNIGEDAEEDAGSSMFDDSFIGDESQDAEPAEEEDEESNDEGFYGSDDESTEFEDEAPPENDVEDDE
eukprot:gnl/TRDRNA2_/TRDRNA2_168853_c0_seq5.p1 gnl/TRDRNA2_/TRDRNA2_168853_c0~~gnl/TRDRNA2_/TRDRNA2_168853_c0_seq5.p1  ORF type:complete len:220 (-),score=89.21 gnl/TRDRNA2_/TRDRNA2_168853_c0_seq5:99-758(-)